VTHLVLGHPAHAGVHGAIEAMAADDEEVESMLTRVPAEGDSRIVCLDRLGAQTGSRRQARLLCAHLDFVDDLEAALSQLLTRVVGRLGVGMPFQHTENHDLGSHLGCEVRGDAKRMLSVPRTVPANENSTERPHERLLCFAAMSIIAPGARIGAAAAR
jgi:hypothetical protein